MSSAGRAANSNGCVSKPKEHDWQLGHGETHGSSYSLPPPSTFRFDQIFQCEQFDTELSALWRPHAAAGLCDHGG